MIYNDFLELLNGVKPKRGGGHMALCPGHPDSEPSLSLDPGDNSILIKCQAGCTTPHVMRSLNLGLGDLFYESRGGGADYSENEIEAVYEYTDHAGRPVIDVVRFVGKKFAQRIHGLEEWGLKEYRGQKPLFHLPEVLDGILQGRRVWIVEGEKDVLAMQREGAVATCSIGGAGKWNAQYAKTLRGAKHVRIIADKDEPGFAHADLVGASLDEAAIPYDIVQAKQGKDATDHFKNGYGLDDFLPLPKSYHGVALRSGDMFEPGEIEWIPGWESFFPFAGLAHVGGMPGVNKSTLSALLASTVTNLGHGVLMIGSEDSTEHVVLPRLAASGAKFDKVFFPTKYITLPRDIDGVQENVEENKIRLIIIDPVDAHMDATVDSNNNKSVRSALAPLAFMADVCNCAVVMIGHPNKDRFNKDPLLRVGGSIGIPGISRSAMIMGYHPFKAPDEGYRALAVYKGNWARCPQAKLFRVEHATTTLGGYSIRLTDAGRQNIKPWQLLPTGQTEQEGEES